MKSLSYKQEMGDRKDLYQLGTWVLLGFTLTRLSLYDLSYYSLC